MLSRTLGLSRGLDPLAHPRRIVHGLDEPDGAIHDIGAVVTTHDGLDGLGGLVSVVEGDGRNIVVQDVRLDDTVEEPAADEAELAVDGCGSTLDEGPLLAGVVREGRVGVLEEGDGNYRREKDRVSGSYQLPELAKG